VTGAETVAAMPTDALVQKLKEYHAAPTLLGFGISKPEHVKAALASGAAGAISGSAIVAIIEKNLADKTQMLAELSQFVGGMKAATAL
jgi:tryptophan synthase alpha chain